MLVPFTKPFSSVPDQLSKLIERGMLITDQQRAMAYLGRIGYYRLSAYWYPFRLLRSGPTGSYRADEFLDGMAFPDALKLYVFDKRLRLLVLDAIERIEVALRVDIAMLLGPIDPWAHRKPDLMHPQFGKQPIRKGRNSRKTKHEVWLEKLDSSFANSREDFAHHFNKTYSDRLPIWIAIELWDFGMLSNFYAGMQDTHKFDIASKYNIPRFKLLETWLRSINHIRNICAHHGRLWNRNLDDQPAPTRTGEIQLLDHISMEYGTNKTPFAVSRLYGTAAIIQYLLRYINPGTSWARRLEEHMSNFPSAHGLSIEDAGFPKNWAQLPLWKCPTTPMAMTASDPAGARSRQ
jgi:abortive infection bacteriophage resistance protein